MKYLYILFLIFLPSFIFAENANNLCLNFEFARNTQKGSNGNDVLVLQKILNLDSRTRVSESGPGSVGKETKIFGENTRAALKNFQALFIEQIKIADGKFNTNTRALMNNVCQGPYFTGKSTTVFSTNTIDPNDKVGPQITISGPATTAKDETFRVTINASEKILPPDLASIIIDGGVASDIRKISSLSYSFAVNVNEENTSGQINIQIEADTISDVNENKNENASNELIIEILDSTNNSTSSTTLNLDASVNAGSAELNSILNTLPAAVATDCGSKQVSVYDYSNTCYGRATMINPNTAAVTSASKPQQSILTPMLTGLVAAYGFVKLVGGLDGLKGLFNSGGGGAVIGKCMCPPLMGQETIYLANMAGPSGRFLMTLNPTKVGGAYVGKVSMEAPPVCGKAYDAKTKVCTQQLQDSTGELLRGFIPAPPTFKWTSGI